MNSVTQDMKFRQSLLKYSQKYGVTKAAIKYKTNRQYIYRWLRRYDGTIGSLREKSRRPHHHLNQHTEQELKLIGDMRCRGPNTGFGMYYPFHAVDFAALFISMSYPPFGLHSPVLARAAYLLRRLI